MKTTIDTPVVGYMEDTITAEVQPPADKAAAASESYFEKIGSTDSVIIQKHQESIQPLTITSATDEKGQSSSCANSDAIIRENQESFQSLSIHGGAIGEDQDAELGPCANHDIRGKCTRINMSNCSSPIHIGDQYHIHLSPDCLTILQSGETSVLSFSNAATVRITIEGPDEMDVIEMEEQIMRDAANLQNETPPSETEHDPIPAQGIIASMQNWLRDWLLYLFQVRRGCIELVFVSPDPLAISKFNQAIREGKLDEALSRMLISDKVKALAKGKAFKVKVELVEVDTAHAPDTCWEKKLFECVKKDSTSEALTLMRDRENVNIKDEKDVHILTNAVDHGSLDMVKLLVEKGADVSVVHPVTEDTLLHSAVARGDIAMVNLLLQYVGPKDKPSCNIHVKECIDVNTANTEGQTALQLAAAKGSLRLVKVLLENGASTMILDQKRSLFRCEYEGVQAMIESHRRERADYFMACIRDKRDGFERMKQKWHGPFDHYLQNKAGDTSLMYACKCSRQDIVEFLLTSAVDEHPKSRAIDAPEKNKALDLSRYVHTHACSYDVERHDSGFSEGVGYSHVQDTNRMNGRTALHYAVETGDGEPNIAIVRQLLQRDPGVINLQDKRGQTAIHIASLKSRKNIAKVLLRQPNIDLDLKDVDGRLPEELSSHVYGSTVKRILARREIGEKAKFSEYATTANEDKSTEVNLKDSFFAKLFGSSQDGMEEGSCSLRRNETV